MKIIVRIRIDEELVRSVEYAGATNVPIPDAGEFVVNPQTDGLIVKIKHRIFEYRENGIYVTLEC